MIRFCWHELRTLDVDAAGAFYARVLGLTFRAADGAGVLLAGDRPALGISRLPDAARAAGAPPHWLGHLGVGDVASYARRFVARGAQARGPTARDAGGADFAAFFDPLGAVVALSARTEPAPGPVAFHQLHTTDRERAWSAYAELFGWTPREWSATTAEESAPAAAARAQEDELREQRAFAFDASGPMTGAMANTARAPGTHTHWVHFFRVAELDAAVDTVIAQGGEAFVRATLPSGARVVVCHDPQRAELGLLG